jgi:hypothetical protein
MKDIQGEIDISLRVPFAYGNNGKTGFTPMEVKRGGLDKTTDWKCGECGAVVYFREPKNMRAHFYHKASKDGEQGGCTGGESAIHKECIKMLSSGIGKISLPNEKETVIGYIKTNLDESIIPILDLYPNWVEGDIDVTGAKTNPSYLTELGELRPDLLLHTSFGDLAIEIHFKNKKKEIDRRKYRSIDLPCLEIEAHGVLDLLIEGVDYKDIEENIRHSAKRLWVNPPSLRRIENIHNEWVAFKDSQVRKKTPIGSEFAKKWVEFHSSVRSFSKIFKGDDNNEILILYTEEGYTIYEDPSYKTIKTSKPFPDINIVLELIKGIDSYYAHDRDYLYKYPTLKLETIKNGLRTSLKDNPWLLENLDKQIKCSQVSGDIERNPGWNNTITNWLHRELGLNTHRDIGHIKKARKGGEVIHYLGIAKKKHIKCKAYDIVNVVVCDEIKSFSDVVFHNAPEKMKMELLWLDQHEALKSPKEECTCNQWGGSYEILWTYPNEFLDKNPELKKENFIDQSLIKLLPEFMHYYVRRLEVVNGVLEADLYINKTKDLKIDLDKRLGEYLWLLVSTELDMPTKVDFLRDDGHFFPKDGIELIKKNFERLQLEDKEACYGRYEYPLDTPDDKIVAERIKKKLEKRSPSGGDPGRISWDFKLDPETLKVESSITVEYLNIKKSYQLEDAVRTWAERVASNLRLRNISPVTFYSYPKEEKENFSGASDVETRLSQELVRRGIEVISTNDALPVPSVITIRTEKEEFGKINASIVERGLNLGPWWLKTVPPKSGREKKEITKKRESEEKNESTTITSWLEDISAKPDDVVIIQLHQPSSHKYEAPIRAGLSPHIKTLKIEHYE